MATDHDWSRLTARLNRVLKDLGVTYTDLFEVQTTDDGSFDRPVGLQCDEYEMLYRAIGGLEDLAREQKASYMHISGQQRLPGT